MNKYTHLVNEINNSVDDIRHQVYVSKKENETFKSNLNKGAERMKYIEDIWKVFEDEIFKNITATRVRTRAINAIIDLKKSCQGNNNKLDAEIDSLVHSIVELRDNIAKKALLLMDYYKYMNSFTPLSEVKYKEEDKITYFNENGLYDFVRSCTRIIWDMETSKIILKGFTYHPVMCNFSPFSENIIEQDRQKVQNMLWEKLNTSNFRWPVMKYGLEINNE